MAKEKMGKYYIKDYELENMSSYGDYDSSMLKNYPKSLLKAMYAKALIGQDGGIPDKDVAASAFRLDPGTYYGAHAHLRPEIYIIMSGTAECEWGDETFTAGPGTVTYCPPNMSHAMRVTSSEPLTAIIVNWTPDGRREVWDTGAVMLDEEA